LATPSWTYSDWVTFETGSATRISRLRLHIQEVSNKIKSGSYAVEGKSHDLGIVESYLKELMRSEAREAAASGITSGNRAGWTRGKAGL
jgi:hypothetical protein